jgi:hypothetical protein
MEVASAWRAAIRRVSTRAFALGFRVEEFARTRAKGRKQSLYLFRQKENTSGS